MTIDEETLKRYTQQVLMKFDERMSLVGISARERLFFYAILQDALRDGDEFLALLARIQKPGR